jgi:alpha-glucosidase
LGEASFAAAFEDDPRGWSAEGDIRSPWRVLLVSSDLNGLVNSDVIAALGEPPDPTLFPEGLDTAWIRPGKAPCTWMVYGNDGAQWDRQKWFVDLSAAIGCEYLLVDAGWRTERWGWMKGGTDVWARAAELCRYAQTRDVGIVLWHAFPEGRDDGPGLTTVAAREELFRKCREAGVKGVKIDFFNSESREVIGAYEDLLERSARHQLLINFHGANKPTGEPRTWPHEITREGIREQEYVLWDVLPLSHYSALPFTRLAVGHADFLPGYLQSRFLKNTTLLFQMASVVVFSSPFLCWPDNPEAYLQSPLLEFVRSVPVTWDETRILPGSAIGEAVVIARRKAATWYVAVLNCRPEPRTFELDLGPLALTGSALTLYRDGPTKASCQIEAGLEVPADQRLRATLQPGGGWLARCRPRQEFPGWK